MTDTKPAPKPFTDEELSRFRDMVDLYFIGGHMPRVLATIDALRAQHESDIGLVVQAQKESAAAQAEIAELERTRHAEIQRWRDSAFETAASICDQYGAEFCVPAVATDIRALRARPEGDTYPYPQSGAGWVCFHCGERFLTPYMARQHFGATPDTSPGCVLKVRVGGERGLLGAVRESESRLTAAQAVVEAAREVESIFRRVDHAERYTALHMMDDFRTIRTIVGRALSALPTPHVQPEEKEDAADPNNWAARLMEAVDYLKSRLDAGDEIHESAWLDDLMDLHGDMLGAAERSTVTQSLCAIEKEKNRG